MLLRRPRLSEFRSRLAIAPITGMGLIIGEVACGGTGCRAIGSIAEVIAIGFTVAMSHGIGIIGIFAGTIVIIKRLQIRHAQI